MIVDVQRELKLMSHQGAGKVGKEKISWWWFTDDDLDFDTIGFQTVDGVKVYRTPPSLPYPFS